MLKLGANRFEVIVMLCLLPPLHASVGFGPLSIEEHCIMHLGHSLNAKHDKKVVQKKEYFANIWKIFGPILEFCLLFISYLMRFFLLALQIRFYFIFLSVYTIFHFLLF